jgi:hypothetical protein
MYLNGKTKVNLCSSNLQKERDTDRPGMAIGAQQETDSPQKSIRVLLDTGLNGDLLFLEKGSTTCIPVVRRAVPESWGTSNGTFQTKKVSNVKISFVDYSDSKRVHLKPDIVKYARNGAPPAYNLIPGKQTLHDLGVVLDFKEKTITIDEIFLPMRNINNLQLKTSISRVLKLNTSFSQEPASTRGAIKWVVEILDAKDAKADLPAIVRDSHCQRQLQAPEPIRERESLLSLLLKFGQLFDGTLGEWTLPPVSIQLKEGAKLFHGRPYPTQRSTMLPS